MTSLIKKLIFLSLLLLISAPSFSQKLTGIYIGQRADSIETFIGQQVQGHYNSKAWLTKLNAQTIDYKGHIKEVILCKENILMLDFEKGVNLCIHYVMSADTLSSIVTQYLNLTLAEAKQVVLANHDKVNVAGYYFDRNFHTYNRVYIGNDGLVCCEYRRTVISQLPFSILEQLKMIAGFYK